MSFPKKHFAEDESIMLLLFSPSEFVSIGGQSVMRDIKNKFIEELEASGYKCENFQLRYLPRYKDILVFSKIYKDEKKLEKELIGFLQMFKDKYLLDYGTGNVSPVIRVMPIPIEDQPDLK
jgi:hypothetical protein